MDIRVALRMTIFLKNRGMRDCQRGRITANTMFIQESEVNAGGLNELFWVVMDRDGTPISITKHFINFRKVNQCKMI